MTNNTGKVKKYRKKFKYLDKNGARLQRKNSIEAEYVNGVLDESGNKVIRALSSEEVMFLENFYKEYVHNTFVTDSESQRLYKKARNLITRKENIEYKNKHGDFPKEVLQVIESFNKKSKELGNTFYNFWDQKEINSDDYKRRYDIHNNCTKGVQLESFDVIQHLVDGEEDYDNTLIEDLVTESEE